MYICKTLGLAWRPLDKIVQVQGLAFKKNRRTEDKINSLIARHGGLDQLLQALTRMPVEGAGWQRIANAVGLNRYACKILVE